MPSSVRAIAELTDHLYLCGIGAITEANLVSCGITHVLNTAVELADFTYPVKDLKVGYVLMRDSSDENLLVNLDKCLSFIENAKLDGGKTLVHCVAGASRSASVCIAYLVKHCNMRLVDAHDHVYNQRSVIFPNIGFWNCLAEFEENVRGERSVEMRPYICGFIPSFKEDYARYLIKMAWMQDLMLFWAVNICFMFMQILYLLLW